MTVVLKKKFCNDAFIDALNWELADSYGARSENLFNSWDELYAETAFLNNDPKGIQQLPDYRRPISPELLQRSFFWLRPGEFSCKVSSADGDEVIAAMAVAKWISDTGGKYIAVTKSSNFSREELDLAFGEIFTESGYSSAQIWDAASLDLIKLKTFFR